MSNRKKKVSGVDSSMYCLSCRQTTGTTNPQVVQTPNGKYRMTGKCSECGKTKSKFVSSQVGNGLLSGLLGFKNGFPILNQIPILGQLL